MRNRLLTSKNKISCSVVLIICCVVLSVAEAYGQDVVYSCDFESAADVSGWHIVDGSNYPNSWVVGSAVSAGGARSLYVSSDGGYDATYETLRGSTVAYREVTLPADGMYRIEFDWMAQGRGADALYVCWVTNERERVEAWATNNNAVPSGVKMYGRPHLPGDSAYQQSEQWRRTGFVVRGLGHPCKLVFYWTNNVLESDYAGGCIDNIIVSKMPVQGVVSASEEDVANVEPSFDWGQDVREDANDGTFALFPQRVGPGQYLTVTMPQSGLVQIYTLTGAYVNGFDAADGSRFVAPNMPGVYLVRLFSGGVSAVFRVMVKAE